MRISPACLGGIHPPDMLMMMSTGYPNIMMFGNALRTQMLLVHAWMCVLSGHAEAAHRCDVPARQMFRERRHPANSQMFLCTATHVQCMRSLRSQLTPDDGRCHPLQTLRAVGSPELDLDYYHASDGASANELVAASMLMGSTQSTGHS